MSEKQEIEENSLSALRKEKGMTVADVSEQLKLTSDVIRKLEGGQFDRLGAYTYVRGYLMNYTALLGVDAKPYLDKISKSDVDVPLINTTGNVTKSIKLKRQSKNMASYVMFTFLVLVICFGGWYLLKNYATISKKDTNSIEIVGQNGSVNSNNDLAVNDGNGDGEQSPSDAFHYSSLIPSGEGNDNASQVPADASTERAAEAQDKNIEGNGTAESIQQTIDSSAQQLADDVNDGLEPIASIEQASTYQVVIEATETSWVKVAQSDGSNLHNDLLKPGRVVLESDQTLHFRIGNKSQVSITINGEPVDLSQYSRKDIAVFSWPAEG